MITRIFEHQMTTYSYDTSDGNKIPESKTLLESDSFQTIHIFADDGYVFKSRLTNEILTNHISIGSSDSIDNYEEVQIDS